jgi:hypothetical protein
MSCDDPLYAQYEAAMLRHKDHPVVLETTLPTMMIVIAALQLALRHPLFPTESKRVVTGVVQGFLDQVRTLDLVIAQVLERGNDPHHDVSAARRRKGRR